VRLTNSHHESYPCYETQKEGQDTYRVIEPMIMMMMMMMINIIMAVCPLIEKLQSSVLKYYVLSRSLVISRPLQAELRPVTATSN
jgi:hypothetical protein